MNDSLNSLLRSNITLSAQATVFDGNRPVGSVRKPIKGTETALSLDGALWQCILWLEQKDGAIDGEARFTLAKGAVACGNVSVMLSISKWSGQNYVLMPAAAYNGNRYRVAHKTYPPFLHEEDGIGVDMPVTITNVPHLSQGDGPSAIHLRSGDMATPAVGVQMPKEGSGFLLLFEHITAFGYTGVRLEESADRASAQVTIEAPAVRERLYTMANSDAPSDDVGASFAQGDSVTLKFRILLFGCPDVPSLFDQFFEHRKDVCGSSALVHGLPLSAAYRIIENKFNLSQYNEDYQYYMLSADGQNSRFGDWQAGWCGGGLSSLALYYDGSELSRRRANATMDSIFSHLQNKNGYILPIFTGGKAAGDDFCHNDRAVLLTRKDGDVLVFAARHILLAQQRSEEVPQSWLAGLTRLADAFVRLWRRYGQFGQFIDIDTEEILQGGTACGSMIPGGLALAWKVLGDGGYLEVAEASAEYYYEDYVKIGLLNGGPGEILQNPDSESASNMLESYVALYELTGDRRWLPMAEDVARICASWTVSYDFAFPAQSVFGKLGARTLGSVYANVQNKHSAPGFCTLSGASLLRLFRATGDRRYLQMASETAHNITQYLSREDRPIPTWGGGKPMPAGWMCERVNMCDWEGKENIGGVFYGGCWCEVSCLLSYAEIPGVWLLTDTGEAIVTDHVDVTVTDDGNSWQLMLHNPTAFDADVKLLCERRADFAAPWGQCVADGCRKVLVAAGGSVVVQVQKAASPQPVATWKHEMDLQYNPQ